MSSHGRKPQRNPIPKPVNVSSNYRTSNSSKVRNTSIHHTAIPTITSSSRSRNASTDANYNASESSTNPPKRLRKMSRASVYSKSRRSHIVRTSSSIWRKENVGPSEKSRSSKSRRYASISRNRRNIARHEYSRTANTQSASRSIRKSKTHSASLHIASIASSRTTSSSRSSSRTSSKMGMSNPSNPSKKSNTNLARTTNLLGRTRIRHNSNIQSSRSSDRADSNAIRLGNRRRSLSKVYITTPLQRASKTQ